MSSSEGSWDLVCKHSLNYLLCADAAEELRPRKDKPGRRFRKLRRPGRVWVLGRQAGISLLLETRLLGAHWNIILCQLRRRQDVRNLVWGVPNCPQNPEVGVSPGDEALDLPPFLCFFFILYFQVWLENSRVEK